MATRKPDIQIFGDGACSGNPGPGGWATIVVRHSEVLEIGGYEPSTTNNQMELTAIGQGLRDIENAPGEVWIYTDSTYVINGITKWVWGWKKNGWKKSDGSEIANEFYWRRLVELLNARRDKKLGPVEWLYVRGHTGIVANERCDEIAVEFSKGGRPDLYVGPRNGYAIDFEKGLPKSPEEGAVPERSESSAPKGPATYLSLVNGKLERHATWSECEARVKGRPGVKFKKCFTEEEIAEVLRSWGVSQD